MHKQILLLAADISDNSLGRVWILADMLAGAAKVEILGLSMKNRVWAPLASNAAHWMTWLPGGRLPNVLGTLRLALAVRQNPADGCARGNFSSSRIINALAARGISFTQIADWLIPLAKARTVCNPLFQQRYGGELVPHARSEKAFAPQEDIAALRAQFGLPQDARLVMFFGTPHRHKGVDELITAMTLASDKHLHMLIAGLDPQMAEYADYARAAEAALPGRYSFLHYIPWQDAPQLLACADILVVPQKDTPFTRWGQTPAKLFDAMAAGKPLG
ncbi:MAG: glycosyltransferase [Proteobacteria bacterium]|nr:glycosyltransferase [Pseudomonadota bacterium]